MKRVDALRSFIGSGIERLVLHVDLTNVFNVDTAIKLYDYLDEELCEPKAEQQKPKEKLDEPKAEQKKPKEKLDEPKANKPIPEKAVAGSGKREKIDMGKLIALAKAGRTREWIADDMGVSVATVYNYLKKAKEEGRL